MLIRDTSMLVLVFIGGVQMSGPVKNSSISKEGAEMQKIIITICSVCAIVCGVAFADCNGAPVTAKGHMAGYIDYQPYFVSQLKGLAGQDPAVTSVTRLGLNYGFADAQEIGIVRIDDTQQYYPAAKLNGFKNTADLLDSDAGFGLLYAYEISKVVVLPFDLRFQFEYDAPRAFTLRTYGQKPEDGQHYTVAGTYFGLGATKPVLIPGFVVGGSFGVFNAWSKNDDPDERNVSETGSSAFQITAGVDYTIPNTAVTLYTTVGHIDNTSLVGVEDQLGFKARDNKQDYVTYGVRYDI